MTTNNKAPSLDGTGRQKCRHCDHKSLAGMGPGGGLCPFHWAKFNWGVKWASKCYPNHPEAKKD